MQRYRLRKVNKRAGTGVRFQAAPGQLRKIRIAIAAIEITFRQAHKNLSASRQHTFALNRRKYFTDIQTVTHNSERMRYQTPIQ